MRVLVLSAYHADSHRSWLNGLMRHMPDVEWTVLTLPPRYFSWRVRGNSLSWAMLNRNTLVADYDLVLATSMTDLSALRGLVPEICRWPTLVYFHENQFAYPASEQQRDWLEPQMLNVYTALAADKVIFNSDYNRQTLLDGSDQLLAKLPDFVPREQVRTQLAQAVVLPVGIEPLAEPRQVRVSGDRLKVLWNHRWEYDKGPSRLLALVMECDKQGLAIDFYFAGQQFRQRPPEFDAIKQCVENSACLVLKQFGFVADGNHYQDLLRSCDVALSTAIHDFQGLAVLQAVAAGCVPLVPDRLCYPQWFAEDYRYLSSEGDGADAIVLEARGAVKKLGQLLSWKTRGELPLVDVSGLTWPVLIPAYRQLLQNMLPT